MCFDRKCGNIKSLWNSYGISLQRGSLRATGTVISFYRISVIRICDKRFFLFFYNFFILSDSISAPQVGFETEECMGVFFESSALLLSRFNCISYSAGAVSCFFCEWEICPETAVFSASNEAISLLVLERSSIIRFLVAERGLFFPCSHRKTELGLTSSRSAISCRLSPRRILNFRMPDAPSLFRFSRSWAPADAFVSGRPESVTDASCSLSPAISFFRRAF